jgi:hypothetical protein
VPVVPVYKEEQMSVALECQAILFNKTNTSQRRFLTLSTLKEFCVDFHDNLYHQVLVPYDPAARSYFRAMLRGLTPKEQNTLKQYQARLNETLTVLNNRLLRYKSDANPNYLVQIEMVNTCLMTYLQLMMRDMPWHKGARELYFSEAKFNLELLQVNEDGTVTAMTMQAELALATGGYLKERNHTDKLTQQVAKGEVVRFKPTPPKYPPPRQLSALTALTMFNPAVEAAGLKWDKSPALNANSGP